MKLSEALARGLKATALVILLALAWAAPAAAHPGHAPAPKAVAHAAAISPQELPRASSDDSLSEAGGVCISARDSATTHGDGPQQGEPPARTCCGTICTVAPVEAGVSPLPLRVLLGVRLALPSETPLPARAPGLPARPPRTLDIA